MYSPNILTENLSGSGTIIGFVSYGYDSAFKDLLTTYNGVPGSYTYDAIGNPLTYVGGSRYIMTWTRGNKLATVKPNGYNYEQSYTYDADGLRTGKTLVSNSNLTKRINYFRIGTDLRSEWAEDGSYEIVYDYDALGRICGFCYSQNGGMVAFISMS